MQYVGCFFFKLKCARNWKERILYNPFGEEVGGLEVFFYSADKNFEKFKLKYQKLEIYSG